MWHMRLCRFYKIPRFFDFAEFQGKAARIPLEFNEVEAGK
jgi:hypothetical protein